MKTLDTFSQCFIALLSNGESFLTPQKLSNRLGRNEDREGNVHLHNNVI